MSKIKNKSYDGASRKYGNKICFSLDLARKVNLFQTLKIMTTGTKINNKKVKNQYYSTYTKIYIFLNHD